MIKFLVYLRKKETKDDEKQPPAFTDQEKKEISETLHLCLKTRGSIEDKEEIFSTFCVGQVDEDELQAAKSIFLTREPETWEQNILALEKGEFGDQMEDAAFKRWKGKERPGLPNFGSTIQPSLSQTIAPKTRSHNAVRKSKSTM
eukprot:TRINITY_DN701_c0_g1_i1.p1 TRINITY_DN701_c0_g1~~TRINITY_DN701_c0_g1_i1.p1  ORF type:complete len:145 (-),score=33.48 TRINITY_DN701_c0_g1_i1:321-755(-)